MDRFVRFDSLINHLSQNNVITTYIISDNKPDKLQKKMQFIMMLLLSYLLHVYSHHCMYIKDK